jgi:hypothetical protein
MSFVDGVLMEDMKFGVNGELLYFMGRETGNFWHWGASQIHMEWDGGFASFLVMLSHVPIPNTYVFLPNTAIVHACCV